MKTTTTSKITFKRMARVRCIYRIRQIKGAGLRTTTKKPAANVYDVWEETPDKSRLTLLGTIAGGCGHWVAVAYITGKWRVTSEPQPTRTLLVTEHLEKTAGVRRIRRRRRTR